MPDNEVLVSLVAENASLKRNTAKLLKEATAAESLELTKENTGLKARLATVEAENAALLAEVTGKHPIFFRLSISTLQPKSKRGKGCHRSRQTLRHTRAHATILKKRTGGDPVGPQ